MPNEIEKEALQMKKTTDYLKRMVEKTITREANCISTFIFNQPKEPDGIEKFNKKRC